MLPSGSSHAFEAVFLVIFDSFRAHYFQHWAGPDLLRLEIDLFQFALRNRLDVHLIGSVGQTKRSCIGPGGSEKGVLGNAGPAVCLDRTIQDPKRHVRGDYFDHGDFVSCGLVSHRIHHERSFQGQQAGLLDFHARSRNVGANRPLFRQCLAKSDSRFAEESPPV